MPPFSDYSNRSRLKLVEVEGNQVLDFDHPSGFISIVFGRSDWENYEVSYRFRYLSDSTATSTDTYFVLWLRFVDQTFTHYAVFAQTFADMVGINEATSGKARFILGEQYPLEPDIWYQIRAELEGTRIRYFINDSLILTSTSSFSNAGRVGFSTSPGLHVQVDDVLVIAR